jgi:hypothetical protein
MENFRTHTFSLAFAYAAFQAGRKSGTTGAPTGGGLSGVVAGNSPGIGFSEGMGKGEKLDWTLIVPIEVLALAGGLATEMDAALAELEMDTALIELEMNTVLIELALERDRAAELDPASDTTALVDSAPEDDATLLTAVKPLA